MSEENVVQVKSNPFRFSVPKVKVVVVVVTGPAIVVVPELLIVNDPIVLLFVVIVPVFRIVGLRAVNVPPEDKVKLLRFNAVVGTANVVDPKLRLLNQPPVVKVKTAIPEPPNVRLGALTAFPAVVPTVNVLVMSADDLKPPVPVQVKLVIVAIDKLTAAAVVVAKRMLFEPKIIERTFELLETKVPVGKSLPFRSKVPAVNCVAAVPVAKLSGPFKVVVPPGQLTCSEDIALPLPEIVPVANVVITKPEYELKGDSVREFAPNTVLAKAKEVVPKLRWLK